MKRGGDIIKNQLSKIITDDTILVVLGGSRATNTFTSKSDYDFFVVTKSTSKVVIYKTNNIRVECFYYSLKRLLNCVKSNDHIVIHVLATGKLIYSNNRKAKKIILWMKSLNKFYQIQPKMLLKFKYRFEMIEEKLKFCEDELTVRWFNVFALPYIIRFLFYFNHSVCPTTKRWPIDVLKLSNVPKSFRKKFDIMLGKSPVSPGELKTTILEVLNYIKKEIGTPPDCYIIPMSDNDITTIV